MKLNSSVICAYAIVILAATFVISLPNAKHTHANSLQQSTPTPQIPAELDSITADNVEQLEMLLEFTFGDSVNGVVGGLDWSTSGRTLAFSTLYPNGIWILDLNPPSPSPRQISESWGDPLALSPDGSFLVTTLSRRQLAVLEVETGEQTDIFNDIDVTDYYGLDLSPDGSMVATADLTGQINVWGVETGEVLWNFDSTTLGIEQNDPSLVVNGVAFSPDGQTIAFAQKLDPSVYLWHLGETPILLEGEQSEHVASNIHELEFSPDGSILAGSDRGGNVQIWQLESGDHTVLATHQGNAGATGIAFSPDGGLLAVGTGDATLEVWNMETMERISMVQAYYFGPDNNYTGRVWSLAWSPDGKIIATGAHADGLRLWGIPSGQE